MSARITCKHYVSVFCFLRLIQLMEEIMAEKENKTIIFVETKKRCDDLTRRMRRDGWVKWLAWIHMLKKKPLIHILSGVKNVYLKPQSHSDITCLSIWLYLTGYWFFFQVASDVYSWWQEPARERLGVVRYNKHANIWTTVTCSVVLFCVIVVFFKMMLSSWLSFLAEFRSGKAPILIATDVASRGLGMSCVLKCKGNSLCSIITHWHGTHTLQDIWPFNM